MATLRCRLAQSHSGSRPRNRAQFLDSQSSVFHRDDGLRHHSKRAKPLSFHHFCCICWLGGRLPFWMSILPLSRGPKGWTHGKFVVRILLSFPEGPGILELLHFVGSVVAGGRHSHTCRSLLEPLPDLTAAKPGLRPTQTQSCPLSYLKTDSLHNEGWSGRNLILLHVLLLLSMNLSHSSQFESVYIHMPMFAISSV